ncbi:MAG TPA: hypothetical protein VGE74_10990 [Gemmata sp.]
MGSSWLIAVSVVRKAMLAVALCAASVEAHLRWGFEYHGPGMHQISLLVVVTAIAMFCSGLFVLSSSATAWAFRHKPTWRHWAADGVLFAVWVALAVWVAVTAEVA